MMILKTNTVYLIFFDFHIQLLNFFREHLEELLIRSTVYATGNSLVLSSDQTNGDLR